MNGVDVGKEAKRWRRKEEDSGMGGSAFYNGI